jgi:hypothetical protein
MGISKERDPDTEAQVWFRRTMIGAAIYISVVFAFILR